MAEIFHSPLRYPGGKGLLANFLSDIIQLNELSNGVYYELYAGGAGAALKLLFDGVVKKIVINDADYRIYCFWHSVLNETDRFINLLEKCSLSIKEWQKQRLVYDNAKHESILDVGFSTFYLNRTNRSGILHKAGPIGGINQIGKYLIDARFHKQHLIERIVKIANHCSEIELYNLTAESFMANLNVHGNAKTFFYLDPPYYHKGKDLYLNNYTHEQHVNMANLLKSSRIKYWVVSYDNDKAIKKMYSSFRKATFPLKYSLQEKKSAEELLIFSNQIKIPRTLAIRKNILKLISC